MCERMNVTMVRIRKVMSFESGREVTLGHGVEYHMLSSLRLLPTLVLLNIEAIRLAGRIWGDMHREIDLQFSGPSRLSRHVLSPSLGLRKKFEAGNY